MVGFLKVAVLFLAGCVVIGVIASLIAERPVSTLIAALVGTPWGFAVARIGIDRGWLPL